MSKNLVLIVAFLAVCTLACAQPKAQNLSSIDPRLINGFTMTPMKLTAAEFKGNAPTGNDNASNTKMLIGLRKLQTLQVNGSKSKYFFQIIPYFSFNSWLADTVKHNPDLQAKVLNHEQGHYDIHLLMAAELKTQLSETFFDSRDYAAGILGIRDQLSRDEARINTVYQKETNNGRNADAQKQWDKVISRALQAKSWGMLVAYIKGKV
ncbi:hypothetical protein HQ865_06660 [Mucilaginibacter mali]|uniref:DUF922 domain-containing protein n=1 Tax=Mucilaginibacter mali TaxID=2740462 RepID=A0A7D4Q280_9SPHI|nr:hypothetical protein [Mucilaginibacter mali]QKJ29447.1 hypothetical protein HQ865_06660 [Mucilaginibacter mali]